MLTTFVSRLKDLQEFLKFVHHCIRYLLGSYDSVFYVLNNIVLHNYVGDFVFLITPIQTSAVYSKIAILRSWKRFHWGCTEATAKVAMEWMWAVRLKMLYEGSQGKVWSDSLDCFLDFWLEPLSWWLRSGCCRWGMFLSQHLIHVYFILWCPVL